MKIRALSVVFGLWFTLMPQLVWADATISLGNVSGDAGTNVVVPITLTSNPQNIVAINFTINFDSDKLEYISTARTDILTTAGKELEAHSPQSGQLRVVIYGINQNMISDGVIGNITFSIKSDASVGDITLDLDNLASCTGDANSVTSTAVDAAVTCASGGSGVVSSGGSGCFIATAAFGSPFERHVKTLSEFRDQYLLKSAVGRGFVNIYYRLSPPVAHFLCEHSIARVSVKFVLVIVSEIVYVLMYIPPAVFHVCLIFMLIGLGFAVTRLLQSPNN